MPDQADTRDPHEPIKYRPDIDGLRAIAILSVVAYHVGLRWASGGFFGVDIFFTISGYLIGILVYREIRERRFQTISFYARRAKRILPALFAVLLFGYIAALLMLPPEEMKQFSWASIATLMSGSNLYFWRSTGYFVPSVRRLPLLMTWSLGIEEQFYLFFPVFMLSMRKMRWSMQFCGIGSLAVLSFIASIWEGSHRPTLAYFLLPTRAWELGIGTLLAVLESNGARSWTWLTTIFKHGLSIVGLGAIGYAVVHFDGDTAASGYLAVFPVLGAALIIISRNGIANRALSVRPLVFVGLISYSWYLWHWPILSFAYIVLNTEVPLRIAIAAGLFSLFIAALSYRYIEQPFRRATTPSRLLIKRYAIALAMAIVPPAIFLSANGLPQRNREVERIEKQSKEMRSDICLINSPDADISLNAPCVPTGRGRAVALVGDSHAAVLAGALRRIGDQSGYRLFQFTKASCPALKGVTPVIPDEPEFPKECSQFDREALDSIGRNPDIRVVVIAGYWAGPFLHPGSEGKTYISDDQAFAPMNQAASLDLLQTGLDRFVAQLQDSGKVVYLMQDYPGFPFEPEELMYTRLFPVRRSLARLLGSRTLQYVDDGAQEIEPTITDQTRTVIAAVAAAHSNVRLIDLSSALCSPESCKFAEGDQTLYIDNNHLSPLGAQVALGALKLP
jgi:peptidoglycan/LPS O-acetylase OafA/YrhL